MEAKVARKLFATIRYRFSHLDNGLIRKTVNGKIRRCTGTGNILKNKLVNNELAGVEESLSPGSSGRLIAFCMLDAAVGLGVLWR